MLYVTTRNKHDAYTAHRTMYQDRGSDGGLFVPFRMPVFEKEDIHALGSKSFGQNVADILNLFFSMKLSGWDVDMTIGRIPVKLKPMNYKIVVAEMFHNMDQSMNHMIRALAQKIHPDHDTIGEHTNWVELAIRTALLFGVFGELIRTEQVTLDRPVNVAVTSGSFSAPMAAWYARQMGLPIGTIICGCNENGAPWELLHRGELDTGVLAVNTITPECDFAVPADLERLICAACSQEEAMQYWWSCTEGGTYTPDEEAYEQIRAGMFAAVVSSVRVETIIPSVYHTNQYVLDPYSALAYGALSDYRARTGVSSTTLLMAEKSPMCSAELVAGTMRIDVTKLKQRLAEV